MKKQEPRFELGMRLKDKITGFVGIAVAYTAYLTDCLHYGLQSVVDKDGKVPDWFWFDQSRLDVVDDGVNLDRSAEKGPSGPENGNRPPQW